MRFGTPILASENTAARLLDLSPAKFRALVQGGHLPRAKNIAGLERWDVDELRRMACGESAGGMGDVQW